MTRLGLAARTYFWPIVAAVVLAAGCSPADKPAFHSTDITGATYGKGFELTDHTGQPRSLADFKGKVVTIFFGFTQCPEICPTSLLTMSEVMNLLGEDADKVQVLFITVDPERDSQELLSYYVPAFNPAFIGLYGDPERTAQVAKDFRVYYTKSGDTSGMNYTVDHSAGTYVFDARGRLRLYVKYGESPENIAADIRQLLAEK